MSTKRLLFLLFSLVLVLGLAVSLALAEEPPGKIEGTVDTELLSAAGMAALPGAPSPYAPQGMGFFPETEPNDTPATANALPANDIVVLGDINPATELDYFSFTANAGDHVFAATMTAFSNGGSTDTILEVIDSDGTTVLENDDDSGSFSSLASVIGGVIIPANGTYYVKVDGFSGTSLITPYRLHVRVLSGSPTAEVEPNNDLATATPLAASGWMTGTVTATTDPDFFSFSLNAGDTVFIGLDMDPGRDPVNTNWNGRVGLGLFNNFLLVANDGSTTKPHAEGFFMTVQESGTYYAYVDSTSATGLGPNARYHLSVTVYPAEQQNCTTYTSTDVPVAIGPGTGTVTSTIVLPAGDYTAVTDINATLVLTHTNMPDLDVTLVGPNAATTPLFTDIGSSTQPDMDIGLDDEAGISVGGFTVVTDIIYTPEQPGRLATFDGILPAAGDVWTLQLADDTANTSGGNLLGWSLEICGAPLAPALSLTKTVGTAPGVCATTDDITVTAGTEVYYCYQAENTGDVTFNFHDLTDDQLGTILDDFPYSLAPGALSPQVIVAETLWATTVNSATWTAVTALGSYAYDDTAPFNYIPINTTGTPLNLADDGEVNIVLPFPFTAFGVTSTDLRVANNGAVILGALAGDVFTGNTALPTTSGAFANGPGIIPFWDDIDSDTGNVYWEVQGTAPNRMVIVEWYDRPHFSNIGSATFEVILYEGSNAIKFQYLDVDFGDPLYNNGVSATVGLNENGSSAVQYSFNQPVITNNMAILWTPTVPLLASASDTATVNVVAPNIDVSPLSMVATQAPNTTTQQTLTIANTGDADLEWEIFEEPIAVPPEPIAPINLDPAGEPVVRSADDCAQFENYAGREPEGYAQYCVEDVPQPWVSDNFDPTDIAYAQDIGFVSDNFVSHVLNDFPGQTAIGPNARPIFAMDFDETAGTLYAIDNTSRELGTYNLATGAFTPIAVVSGIPAADNMSGLTIDPRTGVAYVSGLQTGMTLYTIDLGTAVATPIGADPNLGLLIDIAIGPQGVMYGHDIETDAIFTIDTTTGLGTLVGPTGVNSNFAQGMDFDNADGTLYAYTYQGGGANVYGTIDLATGALTPLASSTPQGEFEGATQTVGQFVCDSPADIPWVSTDPITGTTPVGGSSPVDVTFDSTGLALGTYTGNLCVTSNDPDQGPGNGTGLVVVPITLTVEAVPAITISKAPDYQQVNNNGIADFTITVTNTGTLDLVNVTVADALAPGCDSAVGALAAGASTSYTCSDLGSTSSYTNTAVVTSTLPTGGPGPTASDDAFVEVATPTGVALSGFGPAEAAAPLWLAALLLLFVAAGALLLRRKPIR